MKSIFRNDEETVPIPVPKVFATILDPINSIIQKLRKRYGVKHKDQDNPIRHWYLFVGRRPFWGYHLLFIFIVSILGTQIAWAKQKMERDILYDPSAVPVETKANFTANIGHYTAVVQEDPASIVLASIIENSSGYYSRPLLTETKVTEQPKEEPKEEDRTHSITYEVQPGDTLGKIGLRYGLKVATIQYQNELKGETITPGQKLTLPPGDISASVIARADRESRDTYIADRRYSQQEESGFIRPIGGTITRRIGGRHNGTDISAPVGTPIVAARSGQVVQASYGGWNGGYGNIVTIEHGGGVRTRYAHLSNIGVSVGQYVSGGQYIGACGNTGRSTGSHLHFEAIVNGRFTAPF